MTRGLPPRLSAAPALAGSVDRPTRDALILAGLALLLFLAGFGLRDPWPADEPRFALIARDMARSGDWLIPRLGGDLYPDKPPVFMWIAAAFYALTGSLRAAFLMPSLLAGLGTLALVHDLARRLWNPRVALTAGVLLLLTIQFTLQARTAQLDALVTFWTTLGLYGLVRHLLLGPAWGWYTGAWFAMGLGIITKGVGFLPVLLFIPWVVVRLRWPDRLTPARAPTALWLAGPLAMIAAVALWVGPMLWHVAQSGSPALEAYRDELLFRQTAERYADTWTHQAPWWYYLTDAIAWAWLPAVLALPWLIPAWARRLRRGDPRLWLLLGWVVCVLVFFSLSPGKRHVYILPALPAFVMAAAPLIPGLLRRKGPNRVSLALVAVVAGAALAGLLWAFVIAPDRAAALAERHGVAPWGLLAAIAALGVACLAVGLRWRGAAALALLLIGLWQLHGWWAYPLLDPVRSASALMANAERTVPAGGELALAGWKEQFLLQAEGPVYHFGHDRPDDAEMADAVAWLSRSPQRRLMISGRRLEPCFDPAMAQELAYRHRREWVLVSREALTGACPAEPPPEKVLRYDPARGRGLRPAAED